jgi:hypothetical protein
MGDFASIMLFAGKRINDCTAFRICGSRQPHSLVEPDFVPKAVADPWGGTGGHAPPLRSKKKNLKCKKTQSYKVAIF